MSSTAPPTIGYGPLEAFLGAEEGVSFKADNGEFLCPIQEKDEFTYIEVRKNEVQRYEPPKCIKFFVEGLGNGKVRLKDSRGFYLRRTHRHGRYPIEVRQMLEPDASCVFLVCTRNGNVIFQCDNGWFLRRIDKEANLSVCAGTSESDALCEFVPDIGSVIRPSFEIVIIKCCSPRKKEVTVSEKKYINSSSLTQNQTFNLTWERKVTEVTTWERAWGLNTVVSVDAYGIGTRPTVIVCYDGVHGKRFSKENLISEAETVNVTIPPKTTITAKLVVSMNEEAEIFFTADIKKTKVNGVVETFSESGTWKGVVYDSVAVKIEEIHFP